MGKPTNGVVLNAAHLHRAGELAEHLHRTPCACIRATSGRSMSDCVSCTKVIIAAAMTEVSDPNARASFEAAAAKGRC
jgi:hypothetical protein